MESLYSRNEVDYCNLDASVVALLQELPDDATASQLQTRIAMIKLQQASISGNSTYAAKMLEQAIEEGTKDRTSHSLLQQRLEDLQDRMVRAKREEKKADESSSKPSEGEENKEKKSNDDTKEQKNDETDSGKEAVDPAEHARLKKKLQAESARVESLEDMLEGRLQDEIRSIQEEQDAIRAQEERLRSRIRSLEKAIPQALPEDRSNKLRDKLLAAASETTAELAGSKAAACIACHDRDAVLAVIPCGHLCLCDVCIKTVATKTNLKQCPCCRGQLLSTLKIYTTR